MYLFQVIRRQVHASQQLPHGLGQVQVQWLPGSHGHAQQDAQESEMAVVGSYSGLGVEHESICVEAALVSGIGRRDEEVGNSTFQFLCGKTILHMNIIRASKLITKSVFPSSVFYTEVLVIVGSVIMRSYCTPSMSY